MMNRKAILFFALALASCQLFAQTPSPLPKALVFGGSGTVYYDPVAEKNIDTWTSAFEPALDAVWNNTTTVHNPILIGYSQGGMRALNYANYLSMKTCRRIDGVYSADGIISVAGPVRGYTPLMGGKQVLVNRISSVYNDLADGIVAVVFAGMLFNVAVPIVRPVVDATVYRQLQQMVSPDSGLTAASCDEIAAMLVNRSMPKNENGQTLKASNEVIRDFTPGSDYLKTYSTPTTVDVRAHNATVRTGQHLAYFWRYKIIWGVSVGYWSLEWVQDYKTVYVATTYKSYPLLMPDTKIAYLTGTNKDARTLANEQYENTTSADYAKLEKSLDDLAVALVIAGPADAAIAIATGIASGSAFVSGNVVSGVYFAAVAGEAAYYSSKASIAWKMCSDRNYTLNTRILNTTASDGFVTADSTTLPQSATGGRGWNGLDPEMIAYNYTHGRMGWDDAIWGTGGDSIGGNIQAGGKVYELIYNYNADTAKAIVDGSRMYF